jgi:hypothetical protein
MFEKDLAQKLEGRRRKELECSHMSITASPHANVTKKQAGPHLYNNTDDSACDEMTVFGISNEPL